MNWHQTLINETARALDSSPAGLSHEAATERLLKHGKNEIQDKKKKTIFQMIVGQLTDFMILILLAAAVISGLLGDMTDTIIIFAIIVLNAAVGLVQEFRAEKAMEALKSMAAGNARVLRGGIPIDIPASDIVPGDVVLLEAGNILPADVRFFETHQVKADESALTGESNNVEKISDVLPAGDFPLGDRINLGFKGTFITNGRALAYATATGMNTELGSIARLIQTEESVTPLQKRLADFGKRLSFVVLGISALVFFLGYMRGENPLELLLTAISLAVAAIPEALPALVTIALAFGAKRLVKSNALIRKLPAVETLGSVGYICTDKTGTLTINKMTVQEVFATDAGKEKDFFYGQNISPLLAAMALNNDVSRNENGEWLGDSTEVALARYAWEQKIGRANLEQDFPRKAELPFDSKRKLMTTIHQTNDGFIAVTKGAVDVLLNKLGAAQQKEIARFESVANEMAAKGFRVLGYAMRSFEVLPENLDTDKMESDLTLIGFAGMIDPPREEARLAVEECKKAGIKTVMITGDHKLTARAIAKSLGIIASENDLVMGGPELEKMPMDEFAKIVENVRVYARVSPEQKLKIVRALQEKGHFVAMTGDGVNDAPALKNADIGIAMGINGTEVAKEASHLILLDDNFATITVAVKHGRVIFDNILKFIKYIMTGNSGEIWAILLAPFFGLPIPLLAIHILWVNLVTDGLPGLALASEAAEPNIMSRPPRNPKASIFSGRLPFQIVWVGLLIGACTIGIQAWAIGRSGESHWQTMAFTVLCLCQLGNVMAIRSEHESVFKIGLLSNKPMVWAVLITFALQMMIVYVPFFNGVFKTHPLSLDELAVTLAVSSIVFWAVEAEKWVYGMKRKK